MKSSGLALLCLLALSAFLDMASATNKNSEAQKKRRHECGGLVTEPSSSTTPKPSTVAGSVPTTVGFTATESTIASTVTSGSLPTVASNVSSSIPTPPPGMCYCTPSDATPTGPSSGVSVGVSNAPGGGNDGGFHSHCPFIEVCYNVSIHLSVSQQIIWLEWIEMVENTILANSSLTENEKVVELSVSLEIFFSHNIDIYYKLSYVKIVEWGLFIDFLYVKIDILAETVITVITKNQSTGSCKLIDAIKESEAYEEDSASCDQLIEDIQDILDKEDFDDYQKMGQISEIFEAFFSIHVSLKASFESCHIKGYGKLFGFLKVSLTYRRTTTISAYISGTSVSDCAVIKALDDAKKNTSFSPANTTQIEQLQSKITAYFAVEIDVTLRMNFVAEACYEQIQLAPWLAETIQSIMIVGWKGSFYDIQQCSGTCFNSGCGNPGHGVGPNKGTTFGAATTQTVAQSSAAPSSTAGPSTTSAPADCTKCGGLITPDTDNATSLITSLYVAYNTSFTPAQRLGANNCFNTIKRVIYGTGSESEKLRGCHTAFAQYNANNVTAQKLVFDITITEISTQKVWGKVKDFQGCTSA